MKYRAVVFDLDGTLLDTLGDILSAINRMSEQLGYLGVTYDELKTMIGDGAYKMVQRATRETDEEKTQAALRLYNEIYKNTTGETKPFDGIEQLLSFLNKNGIKTAVLSNKPHADAVAICARVMRHPFDIVIGQSEEYPTKPDPKGLLKIVEVFNLPISDCLYVGDGEMDYLTPAKVGMDVVSALWGYRTRAQLAAVGATRFIDKPCDVQRFMI